MRGTLGLYARALGAWVLTLVVVSAVLMLVIVGFESPTKWSLFEIEGPPSPVTVSEAWRAWASGLALLLVPPALGLGFRKWWRGRGGQAA